MKKCAWIIMLALLLSTFYMPVMAADNVVTANGDGYNDVMFSNGYNGFCLDKWMDMAYEGDAFIVKDTSEATNNVTGDDISQYLKIFLVDFFTDNFEKDSDGLYRIKDATNTQAVIYGFADSAKKDWDYKPLTDVVEKYDEGRRISDHGETIEVGDDKITFDFVVMKSQKADQQDFFGYKFTVTTIEIDPDVDPDDGKTDTDTDVDNDSDVNTDTDVDKEVDSDTDIDKDNTVDDDKVEKEESKSECTDDDVCEKDKAPKTGDDNHINLILATLFSAICIAVIVRKNYIANQTN